MSLGRYAALPQNYLEVSPELGTLQGLAIAAGGVFWLVMAVGGYLLAPVRRRCF